MRKIAKAAVALVISSNLLSVARGETFSLSTETWLQGAYFKAGTTLTTFNQGGATIPERGTLARPYTTGEITWSADRAIKFDNTLTVLEGIVATGKLADRDLEAGSLLNFHANRSPLSVTLAKPLALSGYAVDVAARSPLSLYADGSIRVATLNGEFQYVGKATGRRYLLAAATTLFWPSPAPGFSALLQAGPVKQGTLSVAHAYQLDIFPANSVVGLDGAGELTTLRCPITCTYKRIVLNGGGSVELVPSGYFTLIGTQPVTVGTKTYPAGQQLLITPEGTVVAASAPQ